MAACELHVFFFFSYSFAIEIRRLSIFRTELVILQILLTRSIANTAFFLDTQSMLLFEFVRTMQKSLTFFYTIWSDTHTRTHTLYKKQIYALFGLMFIHTKAYFQKYSNEPSSTLRFIYFCTFSI